LNIAGMHDGFGAHAVFVLERSANDIADDLEIAMGVCPETLTALHPVFVNHTQTAKTHVRRVMVIGKRKRVVAVKPSVVGMAAFGGPSNSDH
jgi:hypothetical protein